MDQERALLLAEALESGRYTQGFGALEYVAGALVSNCCLGVACRVAEANGLPLSVRTSDIGWYVSFDLSEISLPHAVQEWFGFAFDNGHFREGPPVEEANSLMELNDKNKFNFGQIAQVIRENWERL